MEEIIALLSSDPEKAIAQLTQYQKKPADLDKYFKEYSQLDRSIRKTQINETQKDKTIAAKDGNPERKVGANRVAIPFAKKIVQVSTAFEVGERVIIKARTAGALADEILRLWDSNRIDDKLQKLIEVKKSETQSAIFFYIQDIDPETMFNKLLGPNKEKEIKSVVRTSQEGQMSPYWDANKDLVAFVWKFTEKVGDKDVNRVWIYDDRNLYKVSDETGSFKVDDIDAHGFSKIPVVYLSQDAPEWYDVSQIIDRYETTFSKLGGSNDYAGYPLLKLYGKLENMPEKGDDGKTLQFPIKERQADGKTIHGDAEFLTMDGAPEAVKLELETLEKLVYTLSSTPQMSIGEIKGLGAVSGIAIRLMFLDAIIKAKLNEGGNRTTIERILNVLISGTVITTNISMKTEAESLFFDIAFKSILPTDFKELVEYLAQGVTAGIISKETAVRTLDLVGETSAELDRITAEKQAAAELIAPTNPEGESQPPAQQ